MKILSIISLLVPIGVAQAQDVVTSGRWLLESSLLGVKFNLVLDLDKQLIENPENREKPSLHFSSEIEKDGRFSVKIMDEPRQFRIHRTVEATYLCALEDTEKCATLKPAPHEISN